MSDGDHGRQRTQLLVTPQTDRRRVTLRVGGRHQDARAVAGPDGNAAHAVEPEADPGGSAADGADVAGFAEASAIFDVAAPDAVAPTATRPPGDGALAFVRDLRASSAANTPGSLARLRAALRRERARGRAGHWTYDLARHLRLVRDVRCAEAAVRAASIAAGVPV